MTDLEKFQKVNSCETIQELCKCIVEFADERRLIQGRTRTFDADHMADSCYRYWSGAHDQPRCMTREFGIPQQAMYLKYSEHSMCEK